MEYKEKYLKYKKKYLDLKQIGGSMLNFDNSSDSFKYISAKGKTFTSQIIKEKNSVSFQICYQFIKNIIHFTILMGLIRKNMYLKLKTIQLKLKKLDRCIVLF